MHLWPHCKLCLILIVRRLRWDFCIFPEFEWGSIISLWAVILNFQILVKNQEPKYEMIFIKVYTCTNIHSNFRKCPEEAYSVRKSSTRHCEWETNLERKMSNWKCWSRNVQETCSNENWKSTSTTLHELVIWSSCDFLKTFQSSKAYF